MQTVSTDAKLPAKLWLHQKPEQLQMIGKRSPPWHAGKPNPNFLSFGTCAFRCAIWQDGVRKYSVQLCTTFFPEAYLTQFLLLTGNELAFTEYRHLITVELEEHNLRYHVAQQHVNNWKTMSSQNMLIYPHKTHWELCWYFSMAMMLMLNLNDGKMLALTTCNS